MRSVLTAPWFYWAVGLAVGLPLLLVLLTEWQHGLRARGSALLWPVTLLRNVLLPLAALLLMMVGATQMPPGSTPVRIVGTLVAVAVLILMLSGIKASVFSSAPAGSWRHRVPGIFLDVIRFGLIAVGAALIFAYIWGANVGGLFTALGIGSIVIGLTLQNSVGQIISGLLMLFEQPFRIGDWLQTPNSKGRVVEVNWRAVHLETGDGLQVTPNSVLAGQVFTNLSRPAGKHTITVAATFAVEDRPDQVCAMLRRVAAQLPMCNPDVAPSAVPVGKLGYQTEIPLCSPGQDGEAKATFLRWIWYAARREGLHLDEAEDVFSEPHRVNEAVRAVVTPILRLSAAQQQEIASHAAVEVFGAGELLQPVGVVPEAVSFIVSGRVLLIADGQDGSRAEVGTLERGTFLGQSTLTRQPSVASAFAVDEVTVVRVERDAIEAVVQKNPLLLKEFGRSIDERSALVLRALAADDRPPADSGVSAAAEAP